MTKEEYTQAIPLIRKEMLRIATDMLGKNGGSEDAVQDALLKLFLDYKKIEVTALKIYSRIVLINVCKDILKRKKRHKTCSIEEIDVLSLIDDTESFKMLEEQYSSLLRVLQKIPSRQKMLIELIYFKKLDVKTVSTITGISVENIHKNISRTRIKLLKILLSSGLLLIVLAFSFDFVFNNRLEKSATPLNAPVAEAEKPVARRQEAETAADTSQSEGGEVVASVPMIIAETESPGVLRRDSVPDKISVCYSFDDEDIVLMASLSIEKTDDGKYRSRLCNYSLVGGEGDNIVFVPSAEMYSGLDSSDFKIRISGTLVYESPEGITLDRDILIEKEMF